MNVLSNFHNLYQVFRKKILDFFPYFITNQLLPLIQTLVQDLFFSLCFSLNKHKNIKRFAWLIRKPELCKMKKSEITEYSVFQIFESYIEKTNAR